MGEVMPLTPEGESNKRFTPVRLRGGYDMGEVDQFLDEVEAELERLNKENDDLRQKLATAPRGGPREAPAPAPPGPQPAPPRGGGRGEAPAPAPRVVKAPEPAPAPTPTPAPAPAAPAQEIKV